MNKEPTKSQQKELWEQFGFKAVSYKDCSKSHFKYGNPKPTDICHIEYTENGKNYFRLGYPQLNLVELFEYIVPKLSSFSIEKQKNEIKYKASVTYNEKTSSIIYNSNPVLALYWALWEVIHPK